MAKQGWAAHAHTPCVENCCSMHYKHYLCSQEEKNQSPELATSLKLQFNTIEILQIIILDTW